MYEYFCLWNELFGDRDLGFLFIYLFLFYWNQVHKVPADMWCYGMKEWKNNWRNEDMNERINVCMDRGD